MKLSQTMGIYLWEVAARRDYYKVKKIQQCFRFLDAAKFSGQKSSTIILLP
jgi:hypothetical protein